MRHPANLKNSRPPWRAGDRITKRYDGATHVVRVERPWAGCVCELVPFGREGSAWVPHVFGAAAPIPTHLADTQPDGQVV